jgi:hypothetical protein
MPVEMIPCFGPGLENVKPVIIQQLMCSASRPPSPPLLNENGDCWEHGLQTEMVLTVSTQAS